VSFAAKSFTERFSAMGDQAEGAFVGVNPTAHRTGLNRPEFSMRGMPAPMRYAPDYMLSNGFYEVMGIASRGDGKLKLKQEKIDSLNLWRVLGPIYLWVYDSSHRRFWEAPIEDWIERCHKYGTIDRFHDNQKPYWLLHHNDFPKTATKIDGS